MPKTQNPHVRNWLYTFAAVVAFLVVFGGFVRLTRSGLSIVEWNPAGGIVPPIGTEAWQAEFSKYQQTPEYQQVNFNMTLPQYQSIFYIEWIHRLLARLAGFLYAIPLLYFVARRTIPLREVGAYAFIGLIFVGQAFAGWYMVASGLLDRPAVSHLRLTIHLLIALALLFLSLWIALGHQYGFNRADFRSGLLGPSVAAFILLLLQITYGGLTAGLKAGHLSDTWPLMFGKLVPADLLPSPDAAVGSPLAVLFIHRWLAFLGLLAVFLLYWYARKHEPRRAFRRGIGWIAGLATAQVLVGILTTVGHMQLPLALLHQANAVLLFAAAAACLYRIAASRN